MTCVCKVGHVNCTWEKLYWYIEHSLEFLCIRGRFSYKCKLHIVLVLSGQGGGRGMLLENLDSLVKMGKL